MRLNPALGVVPRDASSVQIGVEGGLVLDGLTDGDREIVAALATDRDLAGLVEIGRRHDVDAGRRDRPGWIRPG